MFELIFWFAVSFAIVYFTAPKPSTPKPPPPASASEFKVPTAEEGRAVPILFGTRWIKGPNVVWYGDIKSQAVKG